MRHDDDKTIADNWLMVIDPNNARVRAQFFPFGGFDNITSASTSFAGAGSTNFSIFDYLTDYYWYTPGLSSTRNASGASSYSAQLSQEPIGDPCSGWPSARWLLVGVGTGGRR